MSNFDVWMMLFEIHTAPGQGSSSSDGTRKGIQIRQLLNQLGGSRFIVSPTIVNIVKLIGPACVGQLIGNPARQLDVIVGIGVGLGVDFNQGGACLAKGIFFLLSLCARNDNDALVPL